MGDREAKDPQRREGESSACNVRRFPRGCVALFNSLAPPLCRMAKHLLIAAVEVVVKYNLIDYSTNKKGIHFLSKSLEWMHKAGQAKMRTVTFYKVMFRFFNQAFSFALNLGFILHKKKALIKKIVRGITVDTCKITEAKRQIHVC